MGKAKVQLSVAVQEETGIEENEVTMNLKHVREVNGHVVADCELEGYDYVARAIPTYQDGSGFWYVDRSKIV
jgi:hypothetical protein